MSEEEKPEEPEASESASESATEPEPEPVDELSPAEPEPEAADELHSPEDLFDSEQSSVAPEDIEPRASSNEPTEARFTSRRNLVIGGALLALVAIIAIDVTFIMGRAAKGAGASQSASGSGANAPIDFDDPPAQKNAPASAGLEKSAEAEREPEPEPEPAKPKPKAESKKALPGTVAEAATRSCSTSSVDGLSRQIIAQSRCIDPKAFVLIPSRPNLVLGTAVFPYMEASARDRLLKILDANKKKTLTVNSALRTVAQQYLVWRWSANRRCGVQLATPPGDSNHETGLALDIADPMGWRSVLEKNEFRWLGSIDKVHFDYVGKKSAVRNNVDVIAFQQLWNRNHSDDPISETGRYDEETEARLRKSPAAGFGQGARCEKKKAP